MPDLKISQLNNGDPAQTADQIPINRAGVNFSITAGSIASLATANSANTEVLFNNAGVVDGDPQFTFNPTGDVLSLTGQFNIDNLRLDGNTLSSTNANGNIVIAPNGTGDVQVDADTLRVGDSGVAATITTNGAGNLTLSTNEGTNSGTIVINQGANANIVITPNGTGDVFVDADTLRVGDLNAAAILTTNGTGNLTISTNNGTNSGTILITQGVNGAINITPNGTGRTTVTNLTTTSPRIVTGINDTNGNELFLFTATASAVNELTYANAATTGTPTFTASGSDTNIGVRIASKGTGQVQEGYASAFWALASEYDVGSDPNDVPLNQYLGTLAFQDATSVAVGQLRANGVAGIGYTLGAGNTVTQATSRTTGVTINAACGSITLVSAAGQNTYQTFTVTNSSVAATDTIIVNQKSGTDLNIILVTAVAAGSFNISFATTGGTTTEQPVFNFAVIKAVTS